jgi:hypothetical protein
VRRLFVGLAGATALVGCGHTSDSGNRFASCKIVAHDLRICGEGGGNERPHIDVRTDESWREVAGPAAGKRHGAWQGYWRSVSESPDGKTLLATWSAECEVPTAYFVVVEADSVQTVAGNVESIGLGWTRDGRARVKLLAPACGYGAHRPGVYLFDPNGGRPEFVRRLKAAEGG